LSIPLCCSMLRCVAACVAATLLLYATVFSSVLQYVAECCSVLQRLMCVLIDCSMLQCVVVCCSVLQCVAVRCSVLQCVAASLLVCVTMIFSVVCLHHVLQKKDYRSLLQKNPTKETIDLQLDLQLDCLHHVLQKNLMSHSWIISITWLMNDLHYSVGMSHSWIWRIWIIGLFCKRTLQKRSYSGDHEWSASFGGHVTLMNMENMDYRSLLQKNPTKEIIFWRSWMICIIWWACHTHEYGEYGL